MTAQVHKLWSCSYSYCLLQETYQNSFPEYASYGNPAEGFRETVVIPGAGDYNPALWDSVNMTDIWSGGNGTSGASSFQALWEKYKFSAGMEDPFGVLAPSATPSPGIQCMPAPGPFLPCNDLFDWWTLRCSVWIVFLLALLGNGCVVIVLIASRGKMDVPRSV